MSILGQLQPKPGSTKSRKRVGRGDSSGHGGTSCKGHKGQKARTGGRVRWGFEGGQTPMHRRLPKFGFNNLNYANQFDIINLGQIEKMGVREITPESLSAIGRLPSGQLKVLGKGTVSFAVTVKAHRFSESAKSAIEKAGGRAIVIEAAAPAIVEKAKKAKTAN